MLCCIYSWKCIKKGIYREFMPGSICTNVFVRLLYAVKMRLSLYKLVSFKCIKIEIGENGLNGINERY